MDNKFVGLMVGLTVGVLMVSGFLWPVVADATASEKTFVNTGLWRMDELESGDTWVRTASTDSWAYNGEEVLTSQNSNSSTIVGSNWTIRGTGVFWGATYYTNNPDITLTVNEDSVTVVTKTISGIEGYGVKPNGAYLMTSYTEPVYIKGDSVIYATGSSNIGPGLGFVTHIEGNITDGVTAECWSVNNTGTLSNFIVSNVEVHAEEVAGYEDLYKLTGITFDVSATYTHDSTTETVTGTMSYSSYVVPYQVTAEKSWHLDTTQVALVAAIGTLGAIVLIAAAAGSIRRLD